MDRYFSPENRQKEIVYTIAVVCYSFILNAIYQALCFLQTSNSPTQVYFNTYPEAMIYSGELVLLSNDCKVVLIAWFFFKYCLID